MIDKTKLKWYIVNTHAGYEKKAHDALIEYANLTNCQEYFGEIYIPRRQIEKITSSGVRKKLEKISYPGYMLVQMIINEKTRYVIKQTPRIAGFVGDSRAPKPLSDQEVIRLTTIEEKEAEKPVETIVEFEKGETVKIKDGPFLNFNGTIDEVRLDKMRLKVLVTIFGRETPIELTFLQVEKLNKKNN